MRTKTRVPRCLDFGITMIVRTSRLSRSRAGHRFAAVAVGAVALLAGLAACSSDSKAADTTVEVTTPSTSKPTTTTEEEATTTTEAATTTTTEPATTTTAPAEPVYPLTGVENPDPVIAARPALVVKIDNAAAARPQSGFNSADLVYEEIINDNFTRFAMVFHSGDSRSRRPDPVRSAPGRRPVHRARPSAVRVERRQRTVTDAINNSELINIGPEPASGVLPGQGPQVPHNLYSNTTRCTRKPRRLRAAAKQQFTYRELELPRRRARRAQAWV